MVISVSGLHPFLVLPLPLQLPRLLFAGKLLCYGLNLLFLFAFSQYSSFFFAILVLDLHLLDQMTLVVARSGQAQGTAPTPKFIKDPKKRSRFPYYRKRLVAANNSFR